MEGETAAVWEVGGVREGREKSDFVGGRVEVTKRGAEVAVSSAGEMDMQAVRRNARDRSSVWRFFMPGLYCKLSAEGQGRV
ncbi:MAG: hypothetical protein Fur0043_22110 [Anaerolineales bacterium]